MVYSFSYDLDKTDGKYLFYKNLLFKKIKRLNPTNIEMICESCVKVTFTERNNNFLDTISNIKTNNEIPNFYYFASASGFLTTDTKEKYDYPIQCKNDSLDSEFHNFYDLL